MYDKPDLQRYYKEYIPIAQIENGTYCYIKNIF